MYDAKGGPLYKDPVVRLTHALYGHPEAGALWERHLQRVLEGLGWQKVEGWPGVYRHPEADGLLIVYVDDLMLSCPEEWQERIWRALDQRVVFKDPPEPLNRYLGAYYSVAESGKDGPNQAKETKMSIMMESFLVQAVSTFENEHGKVKRVQTPHLEVLPAAGQKEEDEPEGDYARTASSHLMRLLYAARVCRPDLMVAVTRLAHFVSKWKKRHDSQLVRLMGYVAATAGLTIEGKLRRDDAATVELHVYPDADLAGDRESTR